MFMLPRPCLSLPRRRNATLLLAVTLFIILWSQITAIPTAVGTSLSLWRSSSAEHQLNPSISSPNAKEAPAISPPTSNSPPKDDGDAPATPSLVLPHYEYPAILSEEYALPEQEPQLAHPGSPAPVTDKSRLAIVTYLDHVKDPKTARDYYFTNVRMLTYQLLHDNKTAIPLHRRPFISWVVAVSSRVSAAQRAQLTADGATVVEAADLPAAAALNTGDPRWAHVTSKLRLFEWVHYARVLFLDADTLLRGPVHDLFYTPEAVYPRRTNHARASKGQAPMPAEFVFVARPDLAYLDDLDRSLPDDPVHTAAYFNAGFWLAAPDKQMFDFLVGLIAMSPRPFNANMPEQNLLNYAFRHCDYFQDQYLHCKTGSPLGPMPWSKADSLWSSNRPGLKDYAFGVRALHYKGWEMPVNWPLRTLWDEVRNQTMAKLGEPTAAK
ncbi:hypothetical protein BROUX41_003413 [Berkeleyomyces rouxiae]